MLASPNDAWLRHILGQTTHHCGTKWSNIIFAKQIYWLYHSINKQNSLGILYGLNLIFLIATFTFMVFAITLGFIEALQSTLIVFSIVLCAIEIPCVIIASTYSNIEDYGKPFILLAKRKHLRGFTSSLFDWLSWLMTAFLIYLSFQQL